MRKLLCARQLAEPGIAVGFEKRRAALENLIGIETEDNGGRMPFEHERRKKR